MEAYMKPYAWVAAVLMVAFTCFGCEYLNASTRIADIQASPSTYLGRQVLVRGVVQDSWKIPFIDTRFYTVKDATGEMTVMTSVDPPLAGAEVTVRGRIDDVAVIAGRPIGVHLRETEHRILRHRAAPASD
jgi:hypothetical protein